MAPLSLGLIAPKNTPEFCRLFFNFLKNVHCEIYERGGRYDLVWFLNATEELRFIKQNTTTKTLVVGMEPPSYVFNYDPSLLRLSDRYMGYRNFAGSDYAGKYESFIFPINSEEVIKREFPLSMEAHRDINFCLFANHDPNIRGEIAQALGKQSNILAGPFFANRVENKLAVQRRCRFEFITENIINHYYISEKLGQAILGGCVPVYYGCTDIKQKVPPDFFVDLHDFENKSGSIEIAEAIRFCLSSGLHEAKSAEIRKRGYEFLLERSWENALFKPIQRFIDDLNRAGWRCERRNAVWRYWFIRQWLKRLVRSVYPKFRGG
jgi:hypothetical protein